MREHLYHYKARVVSVYDGDTVTVLIDLGLNIFAKRKVRLIGINTPEIRTRDADEKKRGLEARDYLRERVLEKEIIIHTVGKGKYGRWLGEIWTLDDYGDTILESVNDELIRTGHAQKY